MPEREKRNPSRCLRDVMVDAATRNPTAPFLTTVNYRGDELTATYGEFYSASRALARKFHSLGICSMHTCVLHIGNSYEFILAFWALQLIGSTVAPTITQYSSDELCYVLEHSDAWAVISEPQYADKATSVWPAGTRVYELTVAADGSAQLNGEQIQDGSPGAFDDEELGHGQPNECALLLYTSGSTARPKGVRLGQEGSIKTAECFANHLRLHDDDVVLTCMPLFHVNGLFLQMLPAVVSGCHFVLMPKFSASNYWGWIARYRATVAHLVAGPIRILLQQETDSGPHHGLRLMTFGLPLDKGEISDFESRHAVPLLMAWGMTESSGAATLMPLYFGRRPGHQCIGMQMHGWQVIVASDGGLPLAPGEIGEMCIKGPGTMLGYLKDDTAMDAVAFAGGWLHTGDLGYVDEDGYYHFVERMKDMLKPSGENVAASEVESILLLHAGVKDCAVIGLPDSLRYEKVVAYVVASAEPPSGSTLREHCAKHLASFKVPSDVIFVPDLPRSSIGKILKGQLRERAADR